MRASLIERARFAALVAAIGIVAVILVAPRASAAVSGVTATSTTQVAAGVSTVLSGMSVAAGAGDLVEVNVATTSGTLTVDTTTGVTVAYGYTATGAEVAFSGTGAQVNAALASLRLTAAGADQGTNATVSITARNSDGFIYSAQTEHFYEYVAGPAITWTDARADALTRNYGGQDGYLATVPSAEINELITSRIPGAINVWLGGERVLNSGGYGSVWSWVDGPLHGTPFTRCTSAADVVCDFVDSGSFYQAWAPNEPNNSGSGEPYIVTNWNVANGRWNDLADYSSNIQGYVVEYGDLTVGSTGVSGIYDASSLIAIEGVPDAPTGVIATSQLGQVSVAFTAPADDGGEAIDGYQITVSPGGAVQACASSPCVVTGLTGGASYTFTVKAHNTYGWSVSSASAGATVGLVPGTPTGMQTTFVVGSAPSSPVTATGFPAPTFTVTGGALPAGVVLGTNGSLSGVPTTTGAYSVTVTATNTYGSTPATFTGSTGSVPTVTTSSLGSLAWGTAVDLMVLASAAPGATWTVTGGTLPAGLSLGTDGHLTGTPTTVGAYSVTITATNTHGADAETYTGSVAAVPAAAPVISSVTPGNGSLAVAFTVPTFTGGTPITGYEYSLNGGATWLTGPLGAVTSPIELTGLTNGTNYSVTLRAVTTPGGGAASNAVTGTPRTVPDAPTITSVMSGNGSLSVAFTPPASSGGSPVLGYQYSLDGGVTWSTVMVDATSPLVIYGLTNGVAYDVALRAVSSAGEGPASQETSGTPAAQAADVQLALTGASVPLVPAALLFGLGVALLVTARVRQRSSRR